MTQKAVCLISGGIDSATTAHIAKDEGYEIYLLSFKYGQKHKKEIQSAKKIAEHLGSKKHTIFKLNLDKILNSSLTDIKKQIPKTKKIEEIGQDIPTTYVPARNTIFLSIALGYAETLDADKICIGATSADYSGYPDCRPEYIKAYQKMANLATKKTIQGKKIEIFTPLINKKKDEIIKIGKKLGVNFENTWSCYQGKNKACGKCESCLLRLKGFKKAGLKDPIEYQELPKWYKE
ncbi:MAG: 7-cyano-7-deazaguanine synthase QueC [Candidatus Thermoplasmatota archaeon]